jgi:putative glutamine amidotransferase
MYHTSGELMQPLIGITAGKEKSDTGIQKTCLIDKYSQAITQSGGIPLIIPSDITSDSISPLLQKIDGLMLTGGGDIETKRYHGADHPRVYGVDLERDQVEIELLLESVKQKKPVLGICRGIQLINVALGGDLYSDIADQKPGACRHDWFPGYPRDFLVHTVNISNNSLLNQITNSTKLKVNSLHHQAIKTLAPNLKVSALSEDEIIEAVEMDNHPFFLGLQWHPEWIYSFEPTEQIFKAFVNASSTYG